MQIKHCEYRIHELEKKRLRNEMVIADEEELRQLKKILIELKGGINRMEENSVLNDIKPVDSVSVDLDKFNNEKIKIEDIEVKQVKSEYTESKLQWVMRVYSEVLETIGEGEDKVEFRASELFNLIQEEEKPIGFPTGEKSNLGKFLRDLGCKDPQNEFKSLMELMIFLKGKETICKAYEKNNKTFLKFKY